jgi:TPR repeat protein
MRREDIQLRERARRGDPGASLAFAQRLFDERGAPARNYKLGLAYLQEELGRKSRAAIALVCERVPLHVLVAQNAYWTLEEGSGGSRAAAFKYGVWQAFDTVQRANGLELISRLTAVSPEMRSSAVHSAEGMALLMQSILAESRLGLQDIEGVAISHADKATRSGDVRSACYCIRVALLLGTAPAHLASSIWAIVSMASQTLAPLDLPVNAVEHSLEIRAEAGETEAQFGLGRALAGMSYGRLDPRHLVARKSVGRAAGLLLRAADRGKQHAWLSLADLMGSGCRVAGGVGMGMFFLEKAAHSNLPEAQRRLGAILLKEADSLERAIVAIDWLDKAATAGDACAIQLLKTLTLPLPDLPAEYESAMIRRISIVDAALGIRVGLARAIGLTRHEAMSFDGRRDIHSWGLKIEGSSKNNPKGRLAPVVSAEMRQALRHAQAHFSGPGGVDSASLIQRSRMLRTLFAQLGLSESMFFAGEIGRSLSHYGFGRHWASRAAPMFEASFSAAHFADPSDKKSVVSA